MKRILSAIAACSVLFLVSCQKELSEENNGNGPGPTPTPTGNKLTKVVTKTGSDSTVVNYLYNSANKISGFTQTGVQSGQPANAEMYFVRNGSGVIQRQIFKADALLAYGIDSIETFITYDAANNRYKYSVSTVEVFGFSITDSVVYNYDGSGKLQNMIDYTNDGTGYVPYSKTEYTYSGSNLLTEKSYLYDDTILDYELDATATYEYDAKTNPLQFVADAPILGMSMYFPANNTTKITYVAADPSENFTENNTYTYNSGNRPATAVSMQGTETTNVTYYYQ